MVRVKVCGITNEDDLRAAERAGADAIGLIAEVPVDTPREIEPGRAAELAAAAPPFLTTALVSMPETVERAVELAKVVRPDVLQLHGEYDADELRYVRAEADVAVVGVVSCEEADRAARYDDAVDALLVDSASPSGAGGTGETHDWERTRDLVRELTSPVVLAGGLTPANVSDAVAAVRPHAVDVASGVETDGGVKDHDAVRRFVRNAGRRREVEA
ncbi:phosphoribosylanthranilate isomerase [Halegenticoccus tardaugens]|uniref:phosphoribosylanthranilate isomerase n=1 Tax=Halegenticoccus tardaugens TaxID=2071624 RepID=UPI00100A89F3|nr:phosphoribosylanthranilate isomerase [Halegenticoccus tardaugens]